MADAIDYGPTIADLERKRDEIDRTIAMLKALSGMAPVDTTPRNGGSGEAGLRGPGPTDAERERAAHPATSDLTVSYGRQPAAA